MLCVIVVSEPKAFRPTPVNPSVTFAVILTSLVSVIVTRVILFADPVMESYDVFAAGGVMNTSRANQTLDNKITLPYEQNISAEFPFESNYVEVLGSQMHYINQLADIP